MKNMRERLVKEFSEKVYPNPAADPEVAKKLAAGISEFNEYYLGIRFPWILSGEDVSRTITNTNETYETHDPNAPSVIIGYFSKFGPDCLKKLVDCYVPNIRSAGRRFFLETPWQK